MLEALFACIVVLFMPVRAWHRYRRKASPSPSWLYLSETIVLTGVLAGLLYRHGVPLQAIGLHPVNTLQFVFHLAICLTLIIGLDVLSVQMMTRQIRRASVISVPETSDVFTDAIKGGRALAWFIPVTIVGAIWEELCFRGVVFLLTPHTPAGLALGVVAGSLLFGSHHLRNGVAGMAYASFYGVMFSCLYLATRDLIAVIIAHMAGNLFAAACAAPRIARARAEMSQQTIFLG